MGRLFFFIIVTFVLYGCDHNVPTWRAWMFDHPPGGAEQYPETYVSGWKDGCHTAGGATANPMYKFQFGFKQNEALAYGDKAYRLGWDDAYRYCTAYLLQHNFDWFGKRPI